MEIVASTIRVHEYTVRIALASPKHWCAENKHRAAVLPLWRAFLMAGNQKIQHFLCFLVSSASQNNVFIQMGSNSWVIHFIWGAIFQHLGLDVKGCAVHYISVTLSFQGHTSLRASGHGYLSHSKFNAHTHKPSSTYKKTKPGYCTCIFLYCMNRVDVSYISYLKH